MLFCTVNNFPAYGNLSDYSVKGHRACPIYKEMHFSSSKDNNPVMATISYYGVIEEIWEVDYVKFRVPVFKCKWVDSNTGVHVDDFDFTLILQR